MRESVLLEIEDHVAVVTLNREHKYNALDFAMFGALAEVGDRLAGDASVRAIVLRGRGENFCAGMDLSVFESGVLDDLLEHMQPAAGSPANLFQRAAYVWREVPVPVICAISGAAYGGGLQIALGADLRYARPDARLSIMEIEWGLIPDMAITTTLLRGLSPDRVKELAWTGRIIGGIEAERLGIVTAVAEDPFGKAREMAAEIARQSPDAVRAIKRLIESAWDLPAAEALRLEATIQLEVLGGKNQREAVAARLEQRSPRFADP